MMASELSENLQLVNSRVSLVMKYSNILSQKIFLSSSFSLLSYDLIGICSGGHDQLS